MTEYGKLKELAKLCKKRNDSYTGDDLMKICDECPKFDVCHATYELGEIFMGETPVGWNLKDLRSVLKKLEKI